MSQKAKARAIVQERYEFQTVLALSPDGLAAACARAAEGATIRMGGSTTPVKIKIGDDGTFSGVYAIKGVGHLLTIMQFVVVGVKAPDNQMMVKLTVGDFLFKKGSLGMKPTINAGKIMQKFVDVLRAELAAG